MKKPSLLLWWRTNNNRWFASSFAASFTSSSTVTSSTTSSRTFSVFGKFIMVDKEIWEPVMKDGIVAEILKDFFEWVDKDLGPQRPSILLNWRSYSKGFCYPKW